MRLLLSLPPYGHLDLQIQLTPMPHQGHFAFCKIVLLEDVRDIESAIGKLRQTSAKLRSLAYFIENHQDEVGTPADIGDINWGMGLLLSELSLLVKQIAMDLDEYALTTHQRRKS